MTKRVKVQTGDQAFVREMNLSVIMQHVRKHAPISRASLAELTGLNKTTVSSLVQELIEKQLIVEIGVDTTGVGRPAVLLDLNPEAGYIISSEIGVDFISVICTDFAAEIIWENKLSTGARDSMEKVIGITIAMINAAANSRDGLCDNLLGIAVGVPGLVDQVTGELLFAPNLNWRNIPMAEILRASFKDVTLFVDNEANLAALGEFFFGPASGYEEVLYISVGVGLGGAIVRHGQLSRGKTGFAGEFGHMTFDPNGHLCNCGNHGCWETVVSQRAVYRMVQDAARQGTRTLLTELTGGDLSKLTIPLVTEAAQSGDALALDVLTQVGTDLGLGISSLVNALNPDLVIFGGILSIASEFLLPAINREIEVRALQWNRNATDIVLAKHGTDACVMGGVSAVYQAVLASPGNIRRYSLCQE